MHSFLHRSASNLTFTHIYTPIDASESYFGVKHLAQPYFGMNTRKWIEAPTFELVEDLLRLLSYSHQNRSARSTKILSNAACANWHLFARSTAVGIVGPLRRVRDCELIAFTKCCSQISPHVKKNLSMQASKF